MNIKEYLIHNPYLPILAEIANVETHYGKSISYSKSPLNKKQVKARNKNKRSKQARKKQRR
jgi:hypothetical protein